jgi:enediyne biosynthesis protein E4
MQTRVLVLASLALSAALAAWAIVVRLHSPFAARPASPIATGPAMPPPVAPWPGIEPGTPAPRFRDIASEAGLRIPHYNDAHGQYRLVETMGSGVGLIDFDGDGWLDIFVAQGCPLPRDPKQREHTAKLYRNNRDLTFQDVTESAGVGWSGYGEGVAVGDYDGDGRDDLFVAGFGGSVLYRNNGDGTFADATESAGVSGSGWASSCAFADLDHDGDLDLYVARYVGNTVDAAGRPTASCNALPGSLGYCPPLQFPAELHFLYRNDGDGTFTDVSGESGIASKAGNGLGVAIVDLDDDGRPDIFVANDQTPNFLFRNKGGLRFDEVALSWGLAYNEAGQPRAGMGIAVGDYDGDGRVDLLVTNFYREASTLYRNSAPGEFEVTTSAARLTAPSRTKLGFGAGFLDYDNDGELDLFVTNGHVNDVRPIGIPYAMSPQLFRNMGSGRFADVSSKAGPYFLGEWLGRGAAFGDLDNDGATDIVVTHIGRPPAVLRNETKPRGHYLRLSLRGAASSGDATGALVTVLAEGRAHFRAIAAGTSYLSASDRRILIGLGKADRVDRLTIRWPSQTVQTWTDLPVDRSLAIVEGGEPVSASLAAARNSLDAPVNEGGRGPNRTPR